MNEWMKQEERAIFALRDLYSHHGYSRFKMRKFEPYDFYVQNKDFLISDGIITFTDTNGTLMALKPDVTLSIIKNYRRDHMPVQKVYYNENVYRIAGSDGTFHEIMQTGLECMGDVGLYEICEVVLLAAKSLNAINTRFVLDISHMDILWDILASLSISYEEQIMVLNAIRDKNADALKEYPVLQDLISLNGTVRQTLPLLEKYCSTNNAKSALKLLQLIEALMAQNGLSDHLFLDFSIVNDMQYYNGIMFRGYIDGIPTGVLSGGQYDRLMEKMNKGAFGVGFAVYMDQLERLDTRKKRFDIDTVLLYQNDDDICALSKSAEQLTAQGRTVLLLRELPKSLRYEKLIRYDNGRLEILENHG